MYGFLKKNEKCLKNRKIKSFCILSGAHVANDHGLENWPVCCLCNGFCFLHIYATKPDEVCANKELMWVEDHVLLLQF